MVFFLLVFFNPCLDCLDINIYLHIAFKHKISGEGGWGGWWFVYTIQRLQNYEIIKNIEQFTVILESCHLGLVLTPTLVVISSVTEQHLSKIMALCRKEPPDIHIQVKDM